MFLFCLLTTCHSVSNLHYLWINKTIIIFGLLRIYDLILVNEMNFGKKLINPLKIISQGVRYETRKSMSFVRCSYFNNRIKYGSKHYKWMHRCGACAYTFCVSSLIYRHK